MALDCNLQYLLDKLGHDGSEVIWPNLSEPYRRRAFHIQEMIWLARGIGFSVTPFEARPTLQPPAAVSPYEVPPLGDFETLLITTHRAVITGQSPKGSRHAVAWNGSKVYCPSGATYKIEEFGIEALWVLEALK